MGAQFDKQGLLAVVIARVEAKLEDLKAGYGAARDAVLSMPHVMKGKREVFGQESAYLANALALNIQEREHELRTLRGVRLPRDPRRAAMGCLVGVGESGEPIEGLYLILPVCGGMEVPMPDTDANIRIVTPQTPVAKALLGKAEGEEVHLPTNPPRDTTVRLLL
jgi:hypothetical protein